MKLTHHCALAAAGLAVSVTGAVAQTYPDRPLRLIVPYAPGGGTDLTSRLIARQLTGSLNQQVIVDNRAGGASNIGCEIAARSAPDGYTLLMAGISFSINVSMFAKLNYHPVKDFDPVSLVATVRSSSSSIRQCRQRRYANSSRSPRRSPGLSTMGPAARAPPITSPANSSNS